MVPGQVLRTIRGGSLWQRNRNAMRRCGALAVVLLLSACSTLTYPPGTGRNEARLDVPAGVFVSDDGTRLPLRSFPASESPPRAVILALHGFNDYSRTFDRPGAYFAARGVAVYAYDQRGFGAGAWPGVWPGADTLAADASTAARLLRQRHPGTPLYVLGASMGGAVALVAAAGHQLDADGLILIAPAVWARSTQPWYQRLALKVASEVFPGGKIPAHALGRQVSDDPDALQALESDPLVIKKVRFDTLAGLVDLMDQALATAPSIGMPTLVLYGANDRIIPREPVEQFWDRLPQEGQPRRIDYPEGWHLLLRDRQADQVYADILEWLPR